MYKIAVVNILLERPPGRASVKETLVRPLSFEPTSIFPCGNSPPLLFEANPDGLDHVDVAPQVAALGKAAVTVVGRDVPQVDVVDLVGVLLGNGQHVVGAGRGETPDAQGQSVLQGGTET